MFIQIKPVIKSLVPVIVAVFAVGAIVFAWTEPSQAPPSGNVVAPLNIGSTGQSKGGNLMLNTDGVLAYGLLVPFGNVGIGTTTPNAKLDIQGGDIKVRTVTIKGDGSVSTNLNVEKVGGKTLQELRKGTIATIAEETASTIIGCSQCYSDSRCKTSPVSLCQSYSYSVEHGDANALIDRFPCPYVMGRVSCVSSTVSPPKDCVSGFTTIKIAQPTTAPVRNKLMCISN